MNEDDVSWEAGTNQSERACEAHVTTQVAAWRKFDGIQGLGTRYSRMRLLVTFMSAAIKV